MARRMADQDFRDDQLAHIYDARTAPVTGYIDSLKANGRWLPYIAPMHGGVEARMLTVLRDPGPKAHNEGGSGMLCIENADQSAETQSKLMEHAGLLAADFLPWNAYPWYINRAPTRVELEEGAAALRGLIEILPKLEIVMLQGIHARDVWRMALEQDPGLYRRRLFVLETCHPSNQALRARTAEERQRRREHRLCVWSIAGELLRESAAVATVK